MTTWKEKKANNVRDKKRQGTLIKQMPAKDPVKHRIAKLEKRYEDLLEKEVERNCDLSLAKAKVMRMAEALQNKVEKRRKK